MRNELAELLIKLDACEIAREYALNFQTLREAWDKCHRGDWMLWIYKKLKSDNLRELTLAKGHCAATVLHLMKDDRSKKAVDVAIKFGEVNDKNDELKAAAVAAAAAVDDYASDAAAYACAADAACIAADAEADAAYAAAYLAAEATYAYTYAHATYARAYTDRISNQKETADICRKYLTETLFQ